MKSKKKKQSSCAIYRFPYFEKDQGFLRIFSLKALLACLVSGTGAAYFSLLLDVEAAAAAVCAITAAAVCGVFFVLLGLFRRLYVVLFTAACTAVFGFFFKEQLLEYGSFFLSHALYKSDGNFVHTSGLISGSQLQDPVPFLILLSTVFGIICAFSSVQRFHPEAMLTFTAVMIAPAFLSETVHFHPTLAVFAAGIMGLWAMTAAGSANITIAAGASTDMISDDRQYRKSSKKLFPARKLKSDTLHFGKYLSDCVTVFIISLITMGIVSSVFPATGTLKVQDLVTAVINTGQEIGDWAYGLFSGIGFGNSEFQGFFSADAGSIDISNSILPDTNYDDTTPVAEVITQNQDKLYLRGDIGYCFDGTQWDSIADLNFNEISYDYTAEINSDSFFDNYSYSGSVSMDKVFAGYAPEIQYYIARQKLPLAGCPNPFDLIGVQTVKISYLKNFRTVLMAGTPFIFNFRSNDNFDVTGDFVAVRGSSRINSMETSVLYPNGDVDLLIDYINAFNSGYSVYEDISWDDSVYPISKTEYLCYIDSYENFVYDYYTTVPFSELDNIGDFLERFGFSDIYSLAPPYYIGGAENSNDLSCFTRGDSSAVYDLSVREAVAALMESVLKNTDEFEYSLTADNLSGDNTYLGNFLTQTKSGHCALFATAMCLALRYMGVPARYVTGFTVEGEPDYSDSDGNHYTLTEGDLHSWVEVYYDGVGWIPYDPTPSADNSGGNEITTSVTPSPSTTTAAVTSTSVSKPDISESVTTTKPALATASNTGNNGGNADGSQPFDIKILLIIIGAIAAAAVIVLSVSGSLKSLSRKEKERLSFFRRGETAKAVREMLPFMLKLLEMQGIQRQKGETPLKFAQRTDKLLKQKNCFENVMPLFERAEFDDNPSFDEAERKKVYDCVNETRIRLMNSVKAPRRLMLRIKLFRNVVK